MLQGKKIVLGVCGSIAAYKSAVLTRLLIKSGAEVQILMTPSASGFITPLTLSTLSKRPVLTHFEKPEGGEWNSHVDLGLWADLILIGPATANTIAKMANGMCDNLLLATYLSARCPVMIAPAMDLDMYQHPSTLENIAMLESFGNTIIDAEHGELASGLVGTGRMAEPEAIIEVLEDNFERKSALKGKNVLITAGPTFEAIDPVRFIGNHSSGKMGFAIAESAARHGAQVTLVAGPTNLVINSGVNRLDVTSANEMLKVCEKEFQKQDVIVLAAAVADYRPEKISDQKIKKKGETMDIHLVKNPDVAATLGSKKRDKQFMVGFALETQNEKDNAAKKLVAKNLDMIVLNSLNDKGAGFGHDTNKITILHKDNNSQEFGLKTKQEVANDIVAEIIAKIK